ncbi:bacteriocin fulvocin C-related protein [Rheinheimera metallidurans]|uniref:bacteriocin fulvocin C-related protein n=1 Tax=Rheinheimera metallidurans TaxID=2925781 RepID=UPI003002A1CD
MNKCLDKDISPNVENTINIVLNNIDNEIFILEYLSDIPELEQKKVFINLNSKNRSKLWLAHLNREMNTAVLNKFQYETFSEVISFARDHLNFDDTAPDHAIEKITYLYNKINKYFTRADAAKYFASFSSSSTDGVAEKQGAGCACNKAVDFCYIYGPCSSGNCATSSLGCGLLWLGSCNGLCSHMMEP